MRGRGNGGGRGPHAGKAVRITWPSHARYGLVGRITGLYSRRSGASWVLLEGQGIETVVRPWEWEWA